jgi:LmbE family N-acetylglucosaminyl deacetylase
VLLGFGTLILHNDRDLHNDCDLHNDHDLVHKGAISLDETHPHDKLRNVTKKCLLSLSVSVYHYQANSTNRVFLMPMHHQPEQDNNGVTEVFPNSYYPL